MNHSNGRELMRNQAILITDIGLDTNTELRIALELMLLKIKYFISTNEVMLLVQKTYINLLSIENQKKHYNQTRIN